MQSSDALPATALRETGDVSAQFLARALPDYKAAARHLQALPYGRASNRADYRLVLPEGRGTCSTKHALLAVLAAEQQLPIQLTLGIYEMSERNTPGVGAVLSRYGLEVIPEAHCYLTYNAVRIDVTRDTADHVEPIAAFLYEEPITAEQIGRYKVELHQHFLRRWAAERLPGMSWEQVWQVRLPYPARRSGRPDRSSTAGRARLPARPPGSSTTR